MLDQGVSKSLGRGITEQAARFAGLGWGLLLQFLELALEVMGRLTALRFLSDAVFDPGLLGFKGLQVGTVLLNLRHVGFKLFGFPLANRGQETGVGFALALAGVRDGQKVQGYRALQLRSAADIDHPLNRKAQGGKAGGSHQGGRGLGEPLNLGDGRMERVGECVEGIGLRVKMLTDDLGDWPISLAVLGEPADDAGDAGRGPATLKGVGGIPTGRVRALLAGERVEGQGSEIKDRNATSTSFAGQAGNVFSVGMTGGVLVRPDEHRSASQGGPVREGRGLRPVHRRDGDVIREQGLRGVGGLLAFTDKDRGGGVGV